MGVNVEGFGAVSHGLVVMFWLVVQVAVLLLRSPGLSDATLTDIHCLKTIKESVEDPNGYLGSWVFADNGTEGVICKFTGVECWHPDENKVLNLRLSDFGLRGLFPRGIENCSSLTGLDLSSNNFSGPIPSDISRRLKFVTSLDLSSNNFSGQIPPGLANCSYLNILRLDNNMLTGNIPLQLGQLGRIKTFSASNNLLSGPVPIFSNDTVATASSYAHNPGLCGGPLIRCVGAPSKSHSGIIAAAAAGSVALTAISVTVILYFLSPKVLRMRKDDDPEGNKWAKSIKGTKGIKLSTFEKSLSKMRFSDLMKATNSFHKDNIVGGGRTGTMYKATLTDGQNLIVKRLQDSQRLEKEFASEMNTLGSLKHSNLVPVLGFCVAGRERLVVYQYMENGALYDRLHPSPSSEPCPTMDWPSRLRVGIGAAKGLAWLHHNCNPRIIHRNISSKCILLDKDSEPKLCDFGLARLMNPIDTHMSTFVNGEFGDLGYVAPEYPQKLVATLKGDVYSFGVVLLELVTGERPTHVSRAGDGFKGSLVEWIWDLSARSPLRTAIDPGLLGHGPDQENELAQFLKVACNCVSATAKERPTMFEVYQLLRAIGERYHFTVDDEIFVPTETDDISFPDDLIVAR